MSWSNITFGELVNVSYVDIELATIHFLIAFVTLLGDVAETYGVFLTILIFTISQKTLVSGIYLNYKEVIQTSMNSLYNFSSYNRLFLLKIVKL